MVKFTYHIDEGTGFGIIFSKFKVALNAHFNQYKIPQDVYILS